VRRQKILAEADVGIQVGGEIQQNSQDVSKDWRPAKYEEPNDDGQHEGIERCDSQHYLTPTGKKKKLGPREIGRIEGWKPAVYETSDTGKFLQKRSWSLPNLKHDITIETKEQIDAQHYITDTGKKKKLGPREIGYISSEWKPAKFSIPETGEFLEPRRTSSTKYNIEKRSNKDTQHYISESGKKKKLGPRQIGRNTEWKPAKYDVQISGNFLDKRRYLVRGKFASESTRRLQKDTQHYITAKGKRKKLGPREIGRLQGWKPAKYELSDTGAFLQKRESSFVGIKGSKHHVRSKPDAQHFITKAGKLKKLGPREIGRISNWSRAKYNIPETGEFLEKKRYLVAGQVPEEVERRDQIDAQHMITDTGRRKKLGPREIGRIKNWKPAEYVKCETGDFLSERGSSYARTYVKENETVRKLGPRDVERPKNWVPAKYDVSVQKLSDEEEAPEDKDPKPDSGFTENPKENANVSSRTHSTPDDTTDELRF